MAHRIKISADTTGFKSDIMKLSREINTAFSRGKISIFDKDTLNLLEGGAKSAIDEMTKAVGKLESKNLEILDALNDQELTEKKILRLSKDYTRNLAEKKRLLREINDLESNHANILAKNGAMNPDLVPMTGGQKFMKGFGRSGIGRIPGLPGGIGALKGLGGMGALGLGVGAGIMGIGALAATRGFQGFNAFNQGVDDRITLMGRGFNASQASGVFNPAQRMGLTAGQLRQGQIQAMDIFGRSGASAEAVTGRARTARALGLSLGDLQGAGAGLRTQLGTTGAQKAFAKLEASLIATEIDGAIGPWLQTAADMLTQLNEDGLGLDTSALAALSALTEGKGGLSPERVQKTLMSIDDSMKTATGEKAGFFMTALSRQNIGAGTVGGAQLAMQMGLFGGSLDKAKSRGLLNSKELNEFSEQGILTEDNGESMRKRMQGISSTFENVAGGMSAIGRALVAQKLTGLQNPVQALEAMKIIQNIGNKATTPEEREKLRKELQELQKSPEEKMANNLDKIATSTEGILQVSQAFKEANLEVLGRQLAPLAVKANEALTNIDKAMVKILEMFGIETAQAQSKREARERAAGLSPSEFGKLPGKERAEVTRALSEEMDRTEKRIGSLKSLGPSLNPGEQKQLALLEKKLETLINLQKEHLDAAKQSISQRNKQLTQMNKPKNSQLSGQPSTTGAAR